MEVQLTVAVAELEAYKAPRLELRAPTTGIVDSQATAAFINSWVTPTGVHEPSVLVINMEGRFPTPAAAQMLVVTLGEKVRSGTHGALAVVIATPDPGLAAVVRALAESYDVPVYLAQSPHDLYRAQVVGKLTAAEQETLDVLHHHGGRVTVSVLAEALGLDHKAAGNRIANLDKRHFLFRVDRPRPEGNVFIDPRCAESADQPTVPQLDQGASADLTADMQTLAEMRYHASPEELAAAWREFLIKHHSELAQVHQRARELVGRSDEPGLAVLASRVARVRARARARRRTS